MLSRAVVSRSLEWTVDAFSGGINTDELVLTLLVAILFWFLAYNADWHIFRLDRVWRVVLPPGLILLSIWSSSLAASHWMSTCLAFC